MVYEFINAFVEKYLDNNIENLVNFNFSLLENDAIFGCPNRTLDSDDSNIARAIYVAIWADKLPMLSLENIGSGCLYRGDTLNTFNTLFSENLRGLYKYTNDEKIVSKVENFRKICYSIGNFLPLPNKSILSQTINTYRGINSWHDYQDKFLLELQKCLNNENNKDDFLFELIKENSFYFDYINNSFENYIKINFLEDYIENNEVKNLFSPYFYHWMNKNITEENKIEYVAFVENYIDITTNIIINRAKKIVKKLKNQ